MCAYSSRDDRIRTCDSSLPKRVLYQAELHPDSGTRYRVLNIIAYFNAQRYQALLGSRCGP